MKTLRRITKNRAFTHLRILAAVLLVLTAAALVFLAVSPSAIAQPRPQMHPLTPTFSKAVAFDVSPALRSMRPIARPPAYLAGTLLEIRPESEGPVAHRARARGLDGALQVLYPTPTIPAPLLTFEGLSNVDNFNVLGGRVNPPDPNGEVGPQNFVEMINLVFAVYDKAGNLLLGPFDTGSLWDGFPVTNCALNAGDPVVLYDQFKDRWLLSQFTPSNSGPEFWNCVAISTTSDPTGSYYRYAFSTGPNFPDYPKYGNWTDSYVITTREFGPSIEYGIGVSALEKNKMTDGDPNARSVRFFIDGNVPELLPLVGDGLLPADIDGKQKPKTNTAIPIIGTQDDDADYGATFDAINIWDLFIKWRSTPIASLELNTQLPTAPFDSIFPCGPDARDCLPQPGITNPAQFLDILSYRQQPTFRLAYRNFKTYESLVTNQSVEATPGVAGVRWYEVRRDGNGVYSIYQQGTYDPGDGVHRWMGSVAMDKKGNMALGYSVVNGTTVYPGIRYTGRLAGDPLGQMTLGEGTIIDGNGVQTTLNSRWGDYTSLNVDPVDDCTFWYVNEYYTAAGQATSTAGWQTRISSFKLPGCN